MFTNSISKTITKLTSITAPKYNFSLQVDPNVGKYDSSQTKFWDESLILVDENDKVMNRISKVEAHLNSYNSTGLAHRAFSVFLFNEKNELLLHQRSHKKVTFPLLWTNSCCSHPLYNEDEMEEAEHKGARRAITRRVAFELGCDLGNIDDLNFMGKIYYSAECDDTWGENEIDYCFFIKKNFQEGDFNFNQDEIENIQWVSRDNILDFLHGQQAKGASVTPWFGAIMHYQLFSWWDALISGNANTFNPDRNIANLNPYIKPIFVERNGQIDFNIERPAPLA